MKSSLFSLLALTVILFDSGCGVHVGNGMKEYSSEDGYKFSYSDRLTLSENEDKSKVTLSNQNLVGSNSEEVSTMQLNVDRSKVIASSEDLRQEVNRRTVVGKGTLSDPVITRGKFEPVSFQGLEGLGWKEVTQTLLKATYLLKTPSNRLLEITITAYSAGEGISLISPITETLGKGEAKENVAGKLEEKKEEGAPFQVEQALDLQRAINEPIAKVLEKAGIETEGFSYPNPELAVSGEEGITLILMKEIRIQGDTLQFLARAAAQYHYSGYSQIPFRTDSRFNGIKCALATRPTNTYRMGGACLIAGRIVMLSIPDRH